MSASVLWSRRGVLLLPAAAALTTVRAMNEQRPQDAPLNLEQLPANLPVPKDDGACRHLTGMALPDLQAYRITPRATDVIEDAAAWMSRQSNLAPDGRVGIVGISFAGGLSISASSYSSA